MSKVNLRPAVTTARAAIDRYGLTIPPGRSSSSVKFIREVCLECAARDIGETEAQAVRSCTGHLLRENHNPSRWTSGTGEYFPAGDTRGVCWLHPYRFGKNPDRVKREWSPEQRAAQATRLAQNLQKPKSL